jgi:hypothetical protein
VPRNEELLLYLPAELDPRAPTAYRARVVRTAPAMSVDGKPMVYLILEFKLSAPLRQQLEQIIKAQGSAPTVSALAPQAQTQDELVLEERDRRGATRHAYPHRIHALTYVEADPQRLVRGHEISAKGMRIAPTRQLSVSDPLTLTLYRGSDQPPLPLQATVRRDDGERGLWLAFGPLSARDRQALNRLLEELPSIESLARGSSAPAPVVLASVEPGAARGRPRDRSST